MVGRLFTQKELFGTLMRAGLEHVVYEQGLKNLMERMNEYIKHKKLLRTCRKPKFDHVSNWFKAFRFFYNYVLTNEEIGSALLSND